MLCCLGLYLNLLKAPTQVYSQGGSVHHPHVYLIVYSRGSHNLAYLSVKNVQLSKISGFSYHQNQWFQSTPLDKKKHPDVKNNRFTRDICGKPKTKRPKSRFRSKHSLKKHGRGKGGEVTRPRTEEKGSEQRPHVYLIVPACENTFWWNHRGG